MAGKPSILGIIASDDVARLNALAGKVQAVALEHKVPAAIIITVNASMDYDQIAGLRHHETELFKSNIPLIVLIGTYEACRQAADKHFSPLAIIELSSTDNDASANPVIAHPYAWPGKYLKITDMAPYLQNVNYACKI